MIERNFILVAKAIVVRKTVGRVERPGGSNPSLSAKSKDGVSTTALRGSRESDCQAVVYLKWYVKIQVENI